MNSRSTSPLSGQSRSNSMDSWVSAASAPSLHSSRGVKSAVRAGNMGGGVKESAVAGGVGYRGEVLEAVSPAGEGVSVEEWLAKMGAFPSDTAFSAVENEAARRYQVRQGVSAVRP